MPRFLVMLALALLCVAGSGQLVGFAPEPCAAECEDDDANGVCSPDCHDCTCCTRIPSALLTGRSGQPEPAALPRARVEGPVTRARSTFAREILHVPKRA